MRQVVLHSIGSQSIGQRATGEDLLAPIVRVTNPRRGAPSPRLTALPDLMSPPRERRLLRSRAAAWVSASLVSAIAGACSSPAKDGANALSSDNLGPSEIQPPAPEPAGKLLADLDAGIRAWSRLTIAADSEEDRNNARLLELDLTRRTHKHIDVLLEQLRTGPPRNRVRAAAALGFTRSVEAQSPLLAALVDPDPDVVHNALLGLAVLQRKDTPLSPICEVYESSRDPETRSNAVFALLGITAAGGGADSARSVARKALSDPEPFARGQACLLAAALGDGESMAPIAALLRDEVPFVSSSAAQGLVQLSRRAPGIQGPAARALAEAFAAAPADRRPRIRQALVDLAGKDLGDDAVPWQHWAAALP